MLRNILIGAFFTVLAVMASAGTPAHAGKKEDIALLQQQIAQLQSDLSLLSQRAGRSDADANVQISQLQAENQRLTGEVEQLTNSLNQMQRRLDQVTRVLAGETFSDLQPANVQSAAIDPVTGAQVGQVGQVGQAGQGGQPGFAPSPVNPAGQAVAPNGGGAVNGSTTGPASLTAPQTAAPVDPNAINLPADPNEAYAYSSNLLLTGDYIKAQQAFELYVQSFPNSVHTPDARFRLGEIYLATGANADAAQAFIGHIRDYPTDPKSAEAHLKLGTAFVRMNQTDQACQIFKQVKLKFPNASQIVLTRTELEMQRIGCR